jgi:hypothetical protein
MPRTLKFGIVCLALTTISFFSLPAFAGMDLGVSGSYAVSHLGLQTHTSKSGKASVSIDLGQYFRLGYSYKVMNQFREGYVDKAEDEAEENLVAFEQEVTQTTHAVDIFAILYAGQVFTPFIFVGAAIKSFKITYQEEGGKPEEDNLGPIPVPNYGAGLAININRQFSLKITNTWSTGFTQEPGDDEARSVRDSQLDIGINYRIE